MARISSEKAVEMIGNRFQLILVASQRARELKQGHASRVPNTEGNVITALTEIEVGKYTLKEYMNSIPSKRKGQRE